MIKYDESKETYYGTKAERLADTEYFKNTSREFYEYDTSKTYVANGTEWIEKQKEVINRVVISPLAQILQSGLTLAIGAVVGEYTLNVTDGTQFTAGDLLKVEENNDNARTFHAIVLSVLDNTLTLDRPIDFPFTIVASIKRINQSADVDGPTTPVIFENTNPFEQPVRITRMMLNIVTTDPAAFNYFGDIVGGLTKGVEFRKRNNDGTYINYYNAKTNNRFQLIMYDFAFFDAGHPQAVNGVSGRFTFEKLGTDVELMQGEALEMIVQDDLTSLLSFEVVTEGNIKV